MRKFIIVLFLALLFFGCTEKQALVTKVVDGDTVEVEDGTRIRLAGINTPERGEPCYQEAKSALDALVGNKSVVIRELGTDKYGRTLAEIYINGENVNLKMLEMGLANRYFGEAVVWADYSLAEEKGRLAEGCMWERHELYSCINVEKTCQGFEVSNGCNVTIDTSVFIKDTSASHRFPTKLVIGQKKSVLITEMCTNQSDTIGLCQNIFNEDGDELFIIEEITGKLIGWHAYGVYAD